MKILLFAKVGAVILLVSDMERSVKFYRDILELPVKFQSKDWTEFFNEDTTIALHPVKRRKGSADRERHEKSRTANVLVGFMVKDLDYTVKSLKEKKGGKEEVKFFKEPTNEPFGKHTIIEDPDGNLISIAEIQSTKPSQEEGFDLIGFFGAE
jgi:catechol 2,3-dioxygenase-like lactoylglutathione lyase family enzyme